MSVLGSDGLSLSVGDGAMSETFNVLRGTTVTKFAITQKVADGTTVENDTWQVGVAVSSQRASVSCEGVMTNEAAPQRIRSLAVNGLAGNFRLALDTSETLSMTGFVTSYRETIQPGSIKQFSFQLDSSGAIAIA